MRRPELQQQAVTRDREPALTMAAQAHGGPYPLRWTPGLAARFVGRARNGFDPSLRVRCGIFPARYLSAMRPIAAVSGWPGDWKCGTNASSSSARPSQIGFAP